MMELDLTQLIGSLGFPIVVCLWFMLKTEKVINKNTEVINKLIGVMNGKS